MKKYQYILTVTILMLLNSCDYLHLKQGGVEDEVIASVGNTNLYKADIKHLFNGDINAKDSLVLINNFIEDWAKRQIILQKSALNLTSEKEEMLDEMVNNYKDELYINYYKEALVLQNVDTTVTREAIENFYVANQEIFRLNEELLQYREIAFDKSNVDFKQLKELFIDFSKESIEQLLLDELKYKSMQLNDSIWFTYSDFMNKYTFLKGSDKDVILINNNLIEYNGDDNSYLFLIKNVLYRNEIAPLEYVEPVIKQMIIHQKKLKYLKELEANLIDEALKENLYKKYVKQTNE